MIWEFQTGGAVFASPSLSETGNSFWASRDKSVYALSKDGNLLWSYETGDWVESVPTLSHDESALYFGSWDNHLYALNATTGNLLWKFETGNLIVSSPSLDASGNLYFGSSDGFFYSLDASGNLRWSYLVGDEIDSSAAIGRDGSIYFGCYDGALYSLSSDGELRWRFETDEPEDSEDWRIKSPVTITSDGLILFGGGNGILYALNSSGNLEWSFESDEKIDTGVTIGEDGEIVFGSRNGSLYQLDENGILEWESYVGDIFYSTPLVASAGTSIVGSYLGNQVSGLTALDAEGAVLWEHLVLNYIDSSPLLDSHGQVLFGDYGGTVYAIESGVQSVDTDWTRFGGGPANMSLQAENAALEAWSWGFYLWLSERGLEQYATLPSVDHDQDGLSLGLEYIYGYDTAEGDIGHIPSLTWMADETGEFWQLDFSRLKTDEALVMAWQFSSNYETWTDLEPAETLILDEDILELGSHEAVRLLIPVKSVGALRLKVTNF
nr:PQQ-binding-like beta-propeller repeat protein [Pelagicoccus albus]